jgi:3-methyladenine DNA glycosylase AlkD
MSYLNVINELKAIANPQKALLLQRYFKTGKGDYAEGDKFLGIMVPEQRKVAKKYENLEFDQIQNLISTNIHEYRFTALQILVIQYKKLDKKGNQKNKRKIVDFFLKNKKYINNWDLVDTSVPYILGMWLLDKDKEILYKLARSKNIWDRRIAIISTFQFIKNNDFKEALAIAKILLNDKHDLIHKATGWMLREIGKKNESILEKFLEENFEMMPRTMLRYAIEKFSKEKRNLYRIK